MNNLKPIVTALELFDRSCSLRRMYYAGLTVAVLYGLPGIIAAVRWW